MRAVFLVSLALFSSLSFAIPNGGCTISLSTSGYPELEIARKLVTINREGRGTQAIGKFRNYTFNFIYNDSGAAGPYDTVALQWTDGAATSQVVQPLMMGAPVKWCIPPLVLFTEIKIEGATIKFNCGSAPVNPPPEEMQKPRAEALAECLK